MRLVGDTSYGAGCAEPGFPGVYGRLADAALREWISSIAPEAISTGSTAASSGKKRPKPKPPRDQSPARRYR
jgi:hypothetical protein